MTIPTMDVFALRDFVVNEYERFATSFTTIHADDIRRQVKAIYAKKQYWPEPLIQVNPNYKRAGTLEPLVAEGRIDPKTAEIFHFPAWSTSASRRQRRRRGVGVRPRSPAP